MKKGIVMKMDPRVVDNVEVTIVGGDISNEEISIYLNQLQVKQNHKIIKADISVDGEFIDVSYKLEHAPFERIRRITGYLVGSTKRWGDSKLAEEKDRVKHG